MPSNCHTQKIKCQVHGLIVAAFALQFGLLLCMEHFVVLM